MQGDGFASEPSGIMEVAMWLCILLLLGHGFYVVLVLGNEGGGPHHIQGR
jgi:hypothetical protein